MCYQRRQGEVERLAIQNAGRRRLPPPTDRRGGAANERKGVLLRLDPAVHAALAGWAADELRSTNAQIEFLLRRALAETGRLHGRTGPTRPGRRLPSDGSAGPGQSAHGDLPG
jgi:hypothetical protein